MFYDHYSLKQEFTVSTTEVPNAEMQHPFISSFLQFALKVGERTIQFNVDVLHFDG